MTDKVNVWMNIVNGGDGSVSAHWFLTEQECIDENIAEEEYGGWAEDCYAMVETYKGSNIHKSAMEN